MGPPARTLLGFEARGPAAGVPAEPLGASDADEQRKFGDTTQAAPTAQRVFHTLSNRSTPVGPTTRPSTSRRRAVNTEA